jgi:hypothetical protein
MPALLRIRRLWFPAGCRNVISLWLEIMSRCAAGPNRADAVIISPKTGASPYLLERFFHPSLKKGVVCGSAMRGITVKIIRFQSWRLPVHGECGMAENEASMGTPCSFFLLNGEGIVKFFQAQWMAGMGREPSSRSSRTCVGSLASMLILARMSLRRLPLRPAP